MEEIANIAGVSSRTVRNINTGATRHDPGLEYPLRYTRARLAALRTRLSKPTKDAVPFPYNLSPHLIDYIGFLSLLGVDISCLLEFKEIYLDELEEAFGRKLSDEDILGIIKLEPAKPKELVNLIKAYKTPKVRLINLDYWVSTGLIQINEVEQIHRLL